MKSLSFLSTRLPPSTLTKALIGFIILVCLSLILATSWQMNQSRRERLATAKIAVSNIVRAAEQQAQDTVRQADNTLRDLVERVEHDGVAGEQQARMTKLMVEDVVNVEGIQGLFIYDAQGNWVANSFSQGLQTKNNSDRAYFIYHRDNPDAAIHIGSIVESRSTGDMVIPISRRINSAGGEFAGVALATVPVAYFQHFFERMDVDDRGVIFLALDNGELLARRPTLAALMTTNVSKGDIFTRYLPHSDSGTAVITSIVDGVKRIYAYQRLSGLPIVAAAGISYQHVFTPWREYAYRSAALIGMIILVLALLSILLYWQIQQLIAAEAELNAARNALEIIAQTDSLTQLANRRGFDRALEKEWGRANRNHSDVAIILLDIDWFKQFNDHYGHLSGDDCLKQIARLIDVSVNRAGDLAARFGGEEFVILLPETDLAGALSVAEKIRSSIEQALIEHLASPLGKVTISAGVVATTAPDKDSFAAILAEADRLLYCAKSQGRNRVEGRFVHSRQEAGYLARTLPLNTDT
ncbi:diguanylate cyclase (GGDEF) domain-containing protein [Pseudomonas flavescens]|uniref:diguanylate cyclase n=1 Tax=Phytopseudomonas flavescens TaxID=29435 RepID=A0A1G8PUV9_9GAMM|nr:sensor domain-containing diguanylate cyclase [Pseudomonas flavescens]SDI96148.1 diguanylate cyclase (GGDEF) domain-containing protein [Pseudomonas flavescens]